MSGFGFKRKDEKEHDKVFHEHLMFFMLIFKVGVQPFKIIKRLLQDT